MNFTAQSRSLQGLGAIDDPAWDEAISLFKDARGKLNFLEDAMRNDSGFAQMYGREITEAEASYQSLREGFTDFYRARFGEVPPGLAGLGVIPVVAILTVAGWVAAIAAVVYTLNHLIDAYQSHVQTTQTQGTVDLATVGLINQLYQQAAVARAQGNDALAERLIGEAEKLADRHAPGGNGESSDWMLPVLVLGAIGAGVYFLSSR